MPTTYYVNNATELGGEVCSFWAANHAYSLGARCVCRVAYGTTAARAFVYECTSAGTSHATNEPTWPLVVGNTVVDGTVTWTCRSPADGDWDNASPLLWYIMAYASAAGDIIFVHEAHNEISSISGSMYFMGSSDHNNPKKIYCVDKADNSLSTGAIVGNGSTAYISYFQGGGYSYGVTFKTRYQFTFNLKNSWVMEGNNSLIFDINPSFSTAGIVFGQSGYPTSIKIIKGNIQFHLVANSIAMESYSDCKFEWVGGALITGSGATSLFRAVSRVPLEILVRDVDLSAVGSGAVATSLVDVSPYDIKNILFSRCKIPSDVGFSIISNSWDDIPMSGKIKLYQCSSENQTIDVYESSYEGTIEDETTIIKGDGAEHGTTGFSLKMESSANTVDRVNGLISFDLQPVWNTSTSAITLTIEGITDSATNLQNDEVWLEAEYPANATDGLGAVALSRCTPLATPADLTASTVTWTTTGMTNPNKFKLTLTFTPGKAGPISSRVCLAKPSTTIYIDPSVSVA